MLETMMSSYALLLAESVVVPTAHEVIQRCGHFSSQHVWSFLAHSIPFSPFLRFLLEPSPVLLELVCNLSLDRIIWFWF